MPGVGALRRVHGRHRRGARQADHRPQAGRGPAGAGHLRGHAGAVRARGGARHRVGGVCGVAPAPVEQLKADVLPHMGWNTVGAPSDSVLFAGLDADTRFYFVHSFGVREWTLAANSTIAAPKLTWAHHGEDFVAAVRERHPDGNPVPPGEVG